MAAETALEGATALSPESMSSLGGQITALEMTVSTNDDARTAYMVMQARSSVKHDGCQCANCGRRPVFQFHRARNCGCASFG